MKQTLKLSCFLLLLLASSWSSAEEGRYRVALILPLSGPVASMGEYVRRGAALAYEKLPPEVKSKIELLIEDDQFDTKQTLSVYRRLSAEKRLDGVLVIGSPPANALAPLTERENQLLVAIGGSDPNIVKDRKFAFVHWVIPPVLGEVLAREIAKRDFKRVAFLRSEASGTMADTYAAIQALKNLNRAETIVYEEAFDKSLTDYRSAITQLKARKADAVVVVFFPGALSSFAIQARDMDLKAELIGMETFEDEAEVKASRDALVGKWYVNASDAEAPFVSLYKERWGQLPGWASANAYDTLNILAESIKQSGVNSEAVQTFFSNLEDYSGACGKYSASGDNRFLLPAALKRVTENGFVKIESSASH